MRRVFPLFFALSACNQYEYLQVAGYAQASFSNEADILFVIDNSPSMGDEATALATHFRSFLSAITNPGGGEFSAGLGAAVDDYIAYSDDRAEVLDFQLAITTTDATATWGAVLGPVLPKGTPQLADEFNQTLLCEATCFNPSLIPADPTYVCGTSNQGVVSSQYLDCLCGADAWQGHCGEGIEEGLEAVFGAMCRAAEEPPAACYADGPFTEADIGSNAPFMRENATFIPVLLTDEGDTSRRIDGASALPDPYPALYEEFGINTRWAVIGPTTETCNSGGATTWGTARYRAMVEQTEGSWFNIAESTPSGCAVSDFSDSLQHLGQLLAGLLDLFPLQSPPQPGSIRVFVNGEAVDEATSTEEYGVVTWSDGWTYEAASNAVRFFGEAVPEYRADVRIYYLPSEGSPRSLPYNARRR